MPMTNPPHPGSLVLHDCIEPLGLTITQAAAALGVTRTTLSELVNGKRGISPEMAVRLSKVFGGSPASWLTQQAHYDLAHIDTNHIKLKRLEFAERPAPASSLQFRVPRTPAQAAAFECAARCYCALT